MWNIATLMLLCGVYLSDEGHCQSYDYNCSGTFHPMYIDYAIESPANLSAMGWEEPTITCVWRLVAPPGNRFWLKIENFLEDPFFKIENLLVNDGGRMLTITPGVAMETRSRALSIHYLYTDSSHLEGFKAKVQLVSSTVIYTVHTSPRLPWREAQAVCETGGGTLARVHPVTTRDLYHAMMEEPPGDVWLGQALSPWAWHRGCVSWPNRDRKLPVYTKSKYNQFVECAWACLGHVYFLLQSTACYCVNELDSEERMPYQACVTPCPGAGSETCGGEHTFTKYQYYKDAVEEDDLDKNCMTADVSLNLQPASCKRGYSFSCHFINESGLTTSPHFTMPWKEANDFCGQSNVSLGLKAIPEFEYDDERLWTSVIRKLDWNFPSAVERMPTYAYAWPLNSWKLASTKRGFVCQHEKVTCGGNVGNNTGGGQISVKDFSTNDYCVWSVNVSHDMVVQFDWLTMDLEDSDGCVYDYVEIQDYPGDLVGRFCGTEVLASVISRTSRVNVVFKSDSMKAGGEFKLTWKPVEPPPDAQSIGRKSALSGVTVVAITIAATVAVAIVVIIVVVVRRSPRKGLFTMTPPKSPGVSNAIYGASSLQEDDSEFSSVTASRAYNNLPQPDKDATDYENVEKPVNGAPGPSPRASAGADPTVATLSDLANLGVDSINVVSTQSDETMDSHEYTTVSKKLSSDEAACHVYDTAFENPVDTPPDSMGGAGVCRGNTVGSDNGNVYTEIGGDIDQGGSDGYLKPRNTEAAVYMDVV